MDAVALELAAARRQYYIGTVYLLAVVSLWVISSFIMNSMFTDMEYNKPFLITYLCTATFTLYLLRPAYTHFVSKRTEASRNGHAGYGSTASARKLHGSLAPGYEPVGAYTNEEGVVLIRPDFSFRARSNSRSMSRTRSRPLSVICTDPPLTTRQTAALALVFCGLWFVANWAMNAALGYTSVSSTTILSSMSGFFTLAVGSCVGVENFTTGKLSSVFLSVLGVVIVSLSDSSIGSPDEILAKLFTPDPKRPSAPVLGDALALASALAYAFYVILLKVRIRNETRMSMTLFFGFVGLFNIILIWPMGLVLHFTGVEVWEWPHGQKLWASIAINAAITFVSDALYLRAMLMTSPLAVTLGISLTIPLAMAGDIYRGTDLGGWKIYLGGAMVLGSFVANGLMDLAMAEKEIEAIIGGEDDVQTLVVGEATTLLVGTSRSEGTIGRRSGPEGG